MKHDGTCLADLFRGIIKSRSDILDTGSCNQAVHSGMLAGYFSHDFVQVLSILDVDSLVVDAALKLLGQLRLRLEEFV